MAAAAGAGAGAAGAGAGAGDSAIAGSSDGASDGCAVWHRVWSPSEGNSPDEATVWSRGAGVSDRPADDLAGEGGSAASAGASDDGADPAIRGAVSPAVVWRGGAAAAFPVTKALPIANRTAGGGRISVTADDVDVASVVRNSTTTIIPLWRRCLPATRSADEGALPMRELPGTDGVALPGEGSAEFNADAALVEVAVVMPGDDVPVPKKHRAGSTEPGGETAAEGETAEGETADGVALCRPVVLLLHGGPHSALPGLLSPTVVSMLAEGYGVVFVNFRGSLGYGERSVNSLPGLCGRRDVEDCELALRVAVEASRNRGAGGASSASDSEALHGWGRPLTSARLGPTSAGARGQASAACGELDASRVVAWGGSHGGFLGAHLTAGRGSVAAACLRNPVIDVAAMASATDIPEWCLAEGAGATMDPSQRWYSPEVAAAMHACSPLYALRKGGAPTLVGIGSKDLRVPPFNGYLLHNTLRGQGVPSRLLVYPDDSHPMASFAADVDFCVNGLAWIRHFV
ncbi:hypothetical protein FNF28_05985 [Cafeteria roenbergensis]|uniref:Peptidase S9 prolyl oligopeptidase catalytic domain-containing protein n=1 Tax=Cafeteria roenbergensis TaxID=33653 RepID=A0A5A8D1Y5_CAFRO|nr:hypothetical protein FNF28_05985 [Cafeteria roenbergensis]